MGLTTADSGNILVQNYGRNPAVNFNFMLRVEAIYDLPCRAVRVFQRENEYEYIQEGGLNDYVHMRRKPISKPFTFQVERYVGTDILDPLANGTDLILPVILYVSQYGIYNGPFLPIRMYTFTGCTVMGKEYGELNAERSGLLVETTTIAYREMLCLENVAASFLQSDYWKFSGTSKQGDLSTPQRARHNETTVVNADGDQITIDDAKERLDYQKEAAKANTWQFGKKATEWEGNGNTHKHLNDKGDPLAPSEPRKNKLVENAEKNIWVFDGTKKGANKSGKSFARHMKTNYENAAGNAVGDEEELLAFARSNAEKKMWQFSGTEKTGNEKQSAVQSAADKDWDLGKAKVAAEANRWPSKRSAVDIVKFLEKR